MLGARAEGRFRFQKPVSIEPPQVWGLNVEMRVRRGVVSSAFAGLMFTGGPEWEYGFTRLRWSRTCLYFRLSGELCKRGVCLGLFVLAVLTS